MKKKSSSEDSAVPGVAKSNIEAIMRIEKEFLRQRSQVDLISDRISGIAGSIGFVVAQVILFAGWILLNLLGISGIGPFDPYPFSLLTLVVSLEAIFLSTFVLMSQNRQGRQEDHWAHLHLQIGLLTEQEVAKTLQLLKAVCSHLGLDKPSRDRDLNEMAGKKSVGELAERLAENLERTHDQEKPLPGGR